MLFRAYGSMPEDKENKIVEYLQEYKKKKRL